jgi:flagellar biosynthetic protein FlhB
MATSGERTEKATSRRRKQALDEGQFAYSQDLTSGLVFAATLAVAFYTLGSLARMKNLLGSLLMAGANVTATNDVFLNAIRESSIFLFTVVAPILGAAAVASLTGSVVQGLPRPAPEAATLKWDHLSPSRGLSKLKVKFSLMEWLKIVVLILAVTTISWVTLNASWGNLVSLSGHDVYASLDSLLAALRALSWPLAICLVVLGAGDYLLQRWRFEKNIMQTKSEVKEDMKSTEGNPVIRGRIRSIQRDRARRRMMSRVKDASAIVTNPTHFAVALEYKTEAMSAPRVVAKGKDQLAQRIKELGQKYDIPTVENVALARALYASVELEQEIPAELYKAVAEVLAYVHKMRNRQQINNL